MVTQLARGRVKNIYWAFEMRKLNVVIEGDCEGVKMHPFPWQRERMLPLEPEQCTVPPMYLRCEAPSLPVFEPMLIKAF